jgi:hypothetical protein
MGGWGGVSGVLAAAVDFARVMVGEVVVSADTALGWRLAQLLRMAVLHILCGHCVYSANS